MRFSRISMSIGLMTIIVLGVSGCYLFDKEKDSTGPTSPGMAALKALDDAGSFLYEPSESPGMTVNADFTVHHIEGEPYGDWMLTALWLGDEGLAVAEATVEVSISEDGQGSAVLPDEFLDTVFEAANTGDQAVWLQNPGLVLNFYPTDGQTLQYFE